MQNFLACEDIPAVVQLTQRNIFHTHTSHSLWKSYQTSLFRKKEKEGDGVGAAGCGEVKEENQE